MSSRLPSARLQAFKIFMHASGFNALWWHRGQMVAAIALIVSNLLQRHGRRVTAPCSAMRSAPHENFMSGRVESNRIESCSSAEASTFASWRALHVDSSCDSSRVLIIEEMLCCFVVSRRKDYSSSDNDVMSCSDRFVVASPSNPIRKNMETLPVSGRPSILGLLFYFQTVVLSVENISSVHARPRRLTDV